MEENIYEKIVSEQLVELKNQREEIEKLKSKEKILKKIEVVMLSNDTLINKHDEVARIVKDNLLIFLD